ncbi:MAG: hypothetical protein AAB443_02445 [Patescibacteria group bacterium]
MLHFQEDQNETPVDQNPDQNDRTKKQPRDENGQFTSPNNPDQSKLPFISVSSTPQTEAKKQVTQAATKIPPLLDVKIANPFTYFKLWWNKTMAKEGIDFKLKIHPITAIAITALIAAGSFGLGHITFPKTITNYIPQLAQPTPTPEPNPWRDTAFTGILRYSDANKTYYLTTQASEAITLEVPSNVELSKQISKRIFATGSYNDQTKILKVNSATDLEILPLKITPIPITSSPSATPKPY